MVDSGHTPVFPEYGEMSLSVNHPRNQIVPTLVSCLKSSLLVTDGTLLAPTHPYGDTVYSGFHFAASSSY